MDDNELDKLFGEAEEADKKSPKEDVKAKETTPSKDADEKSEEKDEASDDNGIVEDQNDDSEDSEDTEEDVEVEEAEESKEESDEDSESDEAEDAEDDEEEELQEAPKKISHPKAPKKHIRINSKGISAIAIAVFVIAIISLIAFLPAFRVRNAHVEGNVALSDEEVLRELKLTYNAHLMGGVSGNILDVIRLDYGKTEERIKKENPYIEDIRISVKLPSTVDVRIKERSKVCYIKTADGYAALDREGLVLELVSTPKPDVKPVICGLNVKYAELGKPVVIGDMNDYKKAIIVLGAILAADNASVGDSYCMFDNTSEIRILPSGYMFLSITSPTGKHIQVKLNSLDSISDDMAWLLYVFNSDGFNRSGSLDMTGDDPTFRESK